MPPDPTADRPLPSPVLLAEYTDYPSAQAAVDTLSDAGFPVATTSIVWSGLRRVEHVTGRRTVLTAASEGALSGAWFGSLIGFLAAVFLDTGETNVVSLMLSYLIVGALAGAVWMGVSHALRRGSRDFATISELDAESYQLWVEPEGVAPASQILGITTTRPRDPDPDPDHESV